MKTIWEYTTTSEHDALAQLGREGWELVAVLPGIDGAAPTLYFKRPFMYFRDPESKEQRQRYYAQMGLTLPPSDGSAPMKELYRAVGAQHTADHAPHEASESDD